MSNNSSVDFFSIATRKQNTKASEFGLCDDNDKSKTPAYMDKKEKKKWTAIVSNKENKEVEFVAIDHCPEYDKLVDGAQRCDCALLIEQQVIFVELKQRGYGGWTSEGVKQLKSTIEVFKSCQNTNGVTIKEAYISNSLRPKPSKNHLQTKDTFFEETGYNLKIQRNIVID